MTKEQVKAGENGGEFEDLKKNGWKKETKISFLIELSYNHAYNTYIKHGSVSILNEPVCPVFFKNL